MFDLHAIQSALREFGLDAWLLYDFRGNNPLVRKVLDMQEMIPASRRWFYLVPAKGQPRKLNHAIEKSALAHLPGDQTVYLRWQELEKAVADLCSPHKRIAMEYSPRNGNPYVSVVDGGTIELVKSTGAEVVPSGDLIQLFEATWSDEAWALHQEADEHCRAAFDVAWKMIVDAVRAGKPVRETEVQSRIMEHFESNKMTTYHPPIVGVGPHSGDPHYEPVPMKDAVINEGDFVLIDLWAKMQKPDAVYSDITKVGFVGETVPETYTEIFDIVAAARDAGVACVRDAFAAGHPVHGYEVDDATRAVIEDAGYGEYFIHRTGHSIGEETHGNGTHMDNLETHDDRRILPRTGFSIEPGIYMPEFGVRCEVDVYVDGNGEIHVTGGVQKSVTALMAEY